MELQKPTDRIIKATLVSLVRKVAWGPSRDKLTAKSKSLHEESLAEHNRSRSNLSSSLLSGDSEAYEAAQAALATSREKAFELSWQAELHALAAAARFPRDDDATLKNFVVNIIEDIRQFQERGYRAAGPAMRDVSAAVASALKSEGLELKDLPLPPTLDEMIDRGLPRPDYISEEQWKAAERAYYRQMTLDNTPAEFIYGEGGDDYADYNDDDHSEFNEELDGEAIARP
jgi:hypothetical protein